MEAEGLGVGQEGPRPYVEHDRPVFRVGVDVVEHEDGFDRGVPEEVPTVAVEHDDPRSPVGDPLQQVEDALGPGSERAPGHDIEGRFDEDDVVRRETTVVDVAGPPGRNGSEEAPLALAVGDAVDVNL